MMRIDTHLDGDVLAVELEGRLDTATAPEVSAALADALPDCKACILDLAALDYVSSAGLRLLLVLHKQLEAQGGKLTLRNVQPGVRDILEMTGFVSFLDLA